MKDLKCVFDFQIRICFDTENMTNVYTYDAVHYNNQVFTTTQSENFNNNQQYFDIIFITYIPALKILRGYCTSYQKLACFVLFLKIIKNFLKNKLCIL